MEQWVEDPAEYLRKEADFVEDFWDPRLTAQNVLVDLVALRGEEHLHTIAAHSFSILQKYHSANSPSFTLTFFFVKISDNRSAASKCKGKGWGFAGIRESFRTIETCETVSRSVGAHDRDSCPTGVSEPVSFSPR